MSENMVSTNDVRSAQTLSRNGSRTGTPLPPTTGGDAIATQKEHAKAVLNTAIAKSRDGSPSDSDSTSRKRKRDSLLQRAQADRYVTREYQYKADFADRARNSSIQSQKQQELQYYRKLQHDREKNPAAIFGVGYEGFGNPRTDDRTIRDPILYPHARRMDRKHNRPPRPARNEPPLNVKNRFLQAEQDEDLVPIRLDIEWGKIKLRDTFTWNLCDQVTNVDYFAEQLVSDFGLEVKTCEPLIKKIALDIREQISDYTPHVFTQPEPVVSHLPYFAYKNDEMRILIKLNITIGQNTLIDQFEWEINNPANSPEEFARQMTDDLSLAGEFTTAIAHCIREQCQLFTRSLHLTGYAFDGRVIDDPDLKENFLPSPMPLLFRPYQMAKDFSPAVYEMNEADLEKSELAISRDQRRQKRSTNRRGGPVLPDLKEKPRTVRSLVVSSVIPGGALDMENARLLRVARKVARAGRAQNDNFEEDSQSDSADDSAPDSPALPVHLLQAGTARGRTTMRTAALTASAGIKSNLSGIMGGGRSMTPDAVPALEPRSAARRRNYKDSDSETEAEKMIVVLKVPSRRLAEIAKQSRARRRFLASEVSAKGVDDPFAKESKKPLMLNLAAQPPSAPVAGGGKPHENMFGAVDATWQPPSDRHPAPEPPEWLNEALAELRQQHAYRNDEFVPVMKHVAVDPVSGGPTVPSEEHKDWVHKFIPRIKCNDCPGKLYVTGPGMSAERFEAHLKMRRHREAVEERLKNDG